MTALRGLTGALVTAAAAVAMSPRRAVRCEAPVLDSPDHPQDQSQRCMAYLDEHVRWKTIYSDFSATGVQGNAASLQVMRAESDYTTESGNPVPLMRCIAYMPNVTADQVCSSMADVVKRLQWDKNYRHFAKLSELEEEVLPVNSSLLRPIEAVAQRKRHCQGDVCSFSPDASLSVVDNGFFCHAVGNTTFRRFGLADRLFAYQRVITKSFIRPEQCMYDFLFNGSPAVASSQCSRCPNIGAKLATYRGKSGVVDVDIHYQHHVIIPIADAPRQLCGNAERWDALATSGSLIHHSSTKILYDLLKESSTIPATSPGVLVIMTSASDIGLAARLPAWVENRLAIRTGREAYRMLKETLTQPTT